MRGLLIVKQVNMCLEKLAEMNARKIASVINSQ